MNFGCITDNTLGLGFYTNCSFSWFNGSNLYLLSFVLALVLWVCVEEIAGRCKIFKNYMQGEFVISNMIIFLLLFIFSFIINCIIVNATLKGFIISSLKIIGVSIFIHLIIKYKKYCYERFC